MRFANARSFFLAGLVAFLALTGCQVVTVSAIRLELHQSQLNRSGLARVRVDEPLKITLAPPEDWDRLPLVSNILYAHQQWRSIDHRAGMGVAYLRTPVPFTPQMLIWFAKLQYSHSGDTHGRLIAQWTDSLGRCWFEAEDARYHVRGYAMTRGNDAWIVYSGYRVLNKPPDREIALASRGADSVAPVLNQ
jgi:hypothetical protein